MSSEVQLDEKSKQEDVRVSPDDIGGPTIPPSKATSTTYVFSRGQNPFGIRGFISSIHPFRGIVLDVRARAPFYISDWTDAWNYRVVPATLPS